MRVASVAEVTDDPPFLPNERRVLDLLFRGHCRTQSSIAMTLDLTQQSVSRILATLRARGAVVTADEASPGKRGYPSNAFVLAPHFSHSIGISVMTDAVALAVLDFTGAVVAERRAKFPRVEIADVLDWIDDQIASVTTQADLSIARLAGVGVAIAGSFVEGGGFNTPFALDDWAGIDVEARFADRLGLPAFADNDGNAAAVAESILGVGRWAPSFAYLYLSAGVGGGLILDGKLWRGRFGNAGEFAGGLPPNIYPFPNLELLRQLVAADGIDVPTVDALVQSFDPAWPAIDVWIARVRDSLSIIVSNATAILDLDAVVLGGRMPRALAERVIPAIDLYDQRRRSVPRPVAKLVPAEAHGEVAAIGAGLLPLQKAFF